MIYLEAINRTMEKLCRWLAGFTLILFTLTIAVHVFLRSVFSYPLSWAQDGAVMLFIWTIFLGAPVALRRRSHFIIDLFEGRDFKIMQYIDVLGDVLIYVFLYVMLVDGIKFLEIAHSMYYSYLYISQSYVVVAIPISGLIMSLINTENLILDMRACRKQNNDLKIVGG
jgi:TRAP-type C4-dicarboxylate transport system permease small subunit